MRYTDIPVHIGDKRIIVTYDYSETIVTGKTCTITAEGKEMIVAEDMTVIKGNMPNDWIRPVIEKLKEMLEDQAY